MDNVKIHPPSSAEVKSFKIQAQLKIDHQAVSAKFVHQRAGISKLFSDYSFRPEAYCAKAVALSTNIRLGWKWLTMTSAIAYYGTDWITAVKSFTIPAQKCRKKYLISHNYKIKTKILLQHSSNWQSCKTFFSLKMAK
jgi:hypothetical protein